MLPHVGPPIDGEYCYSLAEEMPEHGIKRRWLYHGAVRSVEWCNGGIVKTRDQFDNHKQPEQLIELLGECEQRGVIRPSSYADIFHQSVTIPPVRRSVVKLFPGVPGGWQVVRSKWGGLPLKRNGVRVNDRELYQYDMRSAYLWSLMQGLPDPATFRSVRKVTGPGLYWCPSPADVRLPFPWDRPGLFPATEEELQLLPLPWRDVRRGIRYDPDSFDVGWYVRTIQSFSVRKQIARGFWGRWGAAGKLTAQTLRGGELSREWEMRDPRKNPVWAALITSRVRCNLWRVVDSPERQVYRVYVDSVVTDTPMDVSGNIGGWVLKGRFPKGGDVLMPGVVALPNAA
jgi:hypothetical protein